MESNYLSDAVVGTQTFNLSTLTESQVHKKTFMFKGVSFSSGKVYHGDCYELHNLINM